MKHQRLCLLTLVLLPAACAMAQPGGPRSSPLREAPAPAGDRLSAVEERRSQLRQTLQARQQADSLVGPQQPLQPLTTERHLSAQERQDLRQQLRAMQNLRPRAPEAELSVRP